MANKKKQAKKTEGKTPYFKGVCPTCSTAIFINKKLNMDTTAWNGKVKCQKCGIVNAELTRVVHKYEVKK